METPPSLEDLGFLPLHPGQQRVESELARYNVVDCGRRFGKTEYIQRKLGEKAIAGQPVAYFSPIYPMVTQVYRDLDWRLAPLIVRRTDGRRIELSTGGVIDFWSMENGADRARGRKYSRVGLDECAMVTDLVAVWEKVVRPTLADLQGDAFFLSTPRRGGGFEELYQRGIAGDGGWRAWKMTTYDNPFIPESEIEEMRAGMSAERFAQEVLADFEAAESDLVYPEFGKHHVKPVADLWRDCKWRVAGIDPGGGDPTAIIPIGVTHDEHVLQPGEFYRKGDVDIDKIAHYIGSLGKLDQVVVGETNGNVLTNTLRRMGFPAVKADMRRDEGLEAVRWLLQSGRFAIDPGCQNSIAEFGGYRWAKRRDPETGDRFATATPFDHHADAMDARRYAWMAVMRSLRAVNGFGAVRVEVR